ncbi:MAG: polyribonucleotide nucleotidyltransferase [Chloroflexi bacterium]|nr:polyribonucleotide nucleotidyltransferase [Chloroflexota bacterium]MBM3154689.1 polyribonucleotide nucleotidyltransferase [Chloroflexota bacterium]MBM3176003.1 polyribonucleotide nucleotidyltransferase [Chloroflexota bacterium]MBM4449943.1 polyribonucleotide nucleotidyltransferase [Chloroflexota bacterium]
MHVPRIFECTIDNRLLTIETGKLAKQASSSVIVRYGDTVVLVTLCASENDREDVDFLRLTVDYEERHYAVGKIPGSFIRREGRPSENAVLAGRLVDRSLRPLFPKGLTSEIQIIVTVLSTDQENDPDILAVIGASAAVAISPLPFAGPIGAIRVGYIGDNLVVNPLLPQMNDSLLDLVVVGTNDSIVMLEAGAREIPEEILLEAAKIGHEACQEIIRLQERMQQEIGQTKMEVGLVKPSMELVDTISSEFGNRLAEAIIKPDRDERDHAIEVIKKEAAEKLKETYTESEIDVAVEEVLKKAARKSILERRLHLDGRQPKEIRPLTSEVGILPRTHGSGLFSRGQTQVLTITTLGSLGQEQLIDGLGLEETKRFMHHYNFPPFSTGEVKRLGATNRREIGHGALAERALLPVIPSEEDFSYTIRLVSEVLSSNGSTSMASVCSSSLSLMDAGVPIKAPVVGIAMGLVTGENSDCIILTDIEGKEDHYGDMDFKVAGTGRGITAIQLDIKLQGISYQIAADAILQAREAHAEIFEKIKQTISASRTELSPYAPRVYRITIDPSKIGLVIGPGGKTIRSIIDQTKTTIDVEDDGTVIVGSNSAEMAQKAIGIIQGLTKEAQVGEVYTGKVTRLLNFGAFVEILPGKEGLVHISELADHRVAKVEDVVKIGDELTVKVVEIDHMGRINLSRRALLPGASENREPRTSRPVGPPRGRDGHSRPRSSSFQHTGRDDRPRFDDKR